MLTETIASKNAAMAGRLAFLDSAATPAKLLAYGTARPATGAAATGSPLAVVTLTQSAGSVTAGVMTLTPAEDALIASTGTVLWCRAVNGDDEPAFDMDAGIAGSGAEAIFSSATLYAGGAARLLSCVLGG